MISTMSAKVKKIFGKVLIVALYVLIWQGLSILVDSTLLLPSPAETAKSFVRILRDGEAWIAVGMTFLRILAGFALGCIAGVLLAVLTANSRLARLLLSPLRTVVKTTPITSFALILLISVVSNLVPVVVSMIMVIPLIWHATETAILTRDPKLEEMGTLYWTWWKRLRYVTIPQVMSAFGAAATTALGFAWKAVITAEILALPAFGVGNELYLCKLYVEYADLFAWTLLVVLLAVGMEWAFRMLWKRKEGKAE